MIYHDWNWLTPQMVINYFSRSAVLSPMFEDVNDALKPLVGLDQPTGQLAQDLAAVAPYLSEIMENGKVRYGGQAVIARLLGVPNAGYHRQNRVLPVVESLESSTSTLPVSPTCDPVLEQAA